MAVSGTGILEFSSPGKGNFVILVFETDGLVNVSRLDFFWTGSYRRFLGLGIRSLTF